MQIFRLGIKPFGKLQWFAVLTTYPGALKLALDKGVRPLHGAN